MPEIRFSGNVIVPVAHPALPAADGSAPTDVSNPIARPTLTANVENPVLIHPFSLGFPQPDTIPRGSFDLCLQGLGPCTPLTSRRAAIDARLTPIIRILFLISCSFSLEGSTV